MAKSAKQYAEGLLNFIGGAPTAFQATEALASALIAHGATELSEDRRFELETGRTYFVRRNGSALIAFSVPEGAKAFRVFAAHSDSPAFRIKENPELQRPGAVVINTEGYGGMIRNTWLDRPLSVAGRVIVKQGGKLVSIPVDLKRPVLLIPNLAIHMDREVNKGRELNLQQELPVYALDGTVPFMKLVADAAGVQRDEILGHDLFVYLAEKGVVWGPSGEFLSSSRLDDLECVFAGFSGFTEGKKAKHIPVLAVLDNEEVGSGTRQGAASTFLKDTLARISSALGDDEEMRQMRIAESFLLSADNGHAVHPNHPEKCDPTNHPVLNGGVLLKYSANQRYTTDGFTAAFVKDLCKTAKVPCQLFFNRSDLPGGSTLGNISVAQVPFPSADIGLAQWAMHSSFETAGTEDLRHLVRLAAAFFA